MGRLLFISIFLFTLISGSVAQTDNPACPKVSVIGPRGPSNPGESITFVADVSGNEFPVKFEWIVDKGKITEGQGTPAIFVTSSEGDKEIKATVRVSGFPERCENSASATESILYLELESIDSWTALKPNEQRARLDAFFSELASNPTNNGFFLLGVSSNQKFDSTNPRVQFIARHARFRKFDLKRLVFALESSILSSTAVYRFPPGRQFPCDKCVIINGRDITRH